MNKIAKSTLAAAAGVALLMGGAGTLAAWSDGTFAPLGSLISAGDLQLSDPSSSVWRDETGAVITLDGLRIAPGDTIIHEATMQLTAHGENLHGEILLDPASIAPVDPGAAADVALANLLATSAAHTLDGRPGTSFTATPGTQKVLVTTTIVWPDGGTPATDNAAMRGRVTLGDMSFTVTQTIG
ncbi:alternate-type signal peptide domain-containing protein [Microbacterium aurugineum]|uniref:alternate-type signal peptide domain-containing protein n=1 Tax=Microbacterium aurugineum TaxID=2851642 RepID=UPI0020BE17CF|nr:alternate-type signal peptide domain-containing protein [Microbacterium aurugineum]MCK8475681.1 alternate-type signal peptide domain-containing protein [Microbacterium aurugineum]